ncbi:MULTISPECIES: oxidoreductase [unclassified Thermoactinomyces]|uniref:oxidoreductase n=1 Tax=unclassified Thermoactinomyces TaxID=2634588 RepID=UPI0018DE2C29|nr:MULTISPECIES: oxidoreductase [unclassified Thermoactinomyces]MBH8596580.1 oxidoreductase [Thermoactinomyces sp. CICC 10523]MBH8603342.1 oxidoreductase [Thermoactinomyces sp. CICC 10522]
MQIRVGLIGFGLSGSTFHAPLIGHVENLELAAVVSSDPAKVHARYPDVKVVPDTEALLKMKEIDIVVISSPNLTHFDYAKKAIEAGKHVVVEKPFTVTSSEADQLIQLAEEKGVILTVYHNRRWDNDFLTIKKILDQQLLGRLSTFESHYDRYRPSVRRRWKEQNLPGSGVLYDLGSHLIDQALLLFGKPQTIWADLRAEREGTESVDYFHLVLGYPELRVILHSGSLVREAGPRFILHGDKGSFIKYGLDPQEEQLKAGLLPDELGFGEDEAKSYGQIHTTIGSLQTKGRIQTIPGRYVSFYEQLAEAVRNDTKPPVAAEEARDVIRMIEYAMQSAQEQRTITLNGHR